MTVDIFTPDNIARWDKYVDGDSAAVLSHSSRWMPVIEKHFNCINTSVMAVEDDAVVGVLPLFLINSLFYGKVLVPNMFDGYCGICGATPQIKDAIKSKALELARTFDVNYLEFRETRLIDSRLSQNTEHCTLSLFLDPDKDALFEGFPKQRRNRIRHAQKHDLRIETGNDRLADFYRIYTRNMKEIGGFAQGFPFFEDILDRFGDMAEVVIVRHKGDAIAGKVIVFFKDTVYNLWSASLKRTRPLSPGNYLDWEIMKTSIDRGMRYFYYGRSQYNTGTYDYKKAWGAQVTPLVYNYMVKEGATHPTLGGERAKFQIPLAIWKALPLPCSRYLGPKLARHIPI